MRPSAPAETSTPRILTAMGSERVPIRMAQTKDNHRPTTSSGAPSAEVASRSRLLPFGWVLFTAVWLLFPIGFVIQVMQSDLSPFQLLALLTSMAALVAVFLWLMLRYPFPDAKLAPTGLRIRIGFLLALAALALYIELAYGGGTPYRLMYVVVGAAVTLPTLHAAWMVAAVTVAAGAVYAAQVGWGLFAASWTDLVPFALIGVGMIAVSRLVVTVRELRDAREEISRLAIIEERLRFARDLHDLLGHSLSQITLKSELAGRLLPTTPETEMVAKEICDIEDAARKALREVREAVAGYRRPTLDGELKGAREMLEAADISYRIENRAGALPNATDAVLGWAVREGVTNVIRHSRARCCEIRLAREGEEIRVEVNDDGLGSESEHGGATSSGLAGLTERVTARGGDIEAGPLPEGGFRLRVSLPVIGSFAGEGGRR